MVKKEFFPGIKKIRFEGPKSKNPLAFKWYNPKEEVAGKSMREHLRFSIAYWHTMKGSGADPFGAPTWMRPWNKSNNPLRIAEDTMLAAFEFFTKLGVDYYCFHDRDICPEGETLIETNKRLDKIISLAKKLQKDTGVKLLWNTSNMFSNPRFAHGAATNPDAHVFAYAGAQVKKMLEAGLELGAENYVFWGGREGYETLLNTDMKRELDHLAMFLRMAVDYAREIKFKGQFLIEPKPKEPTKHQYDFDSATVISFLRKYGLEKYFKLNIEANHATLAGHTFEHDLAVASINGMLGSVDANRGDLLLGWDTDQFPSDIYQTTMAMYIILGQKGLGTGGLNFDAKLRRGSTDLEDLFIAHIGAMDAFALGLKIANELHKDKVLSDVIKNRYSSYDTGIGAKIEAGMVDLKDLEVFILKNGEPKQVSGKQEMLENIINQYLVG
ncbi:MAG: xylose isomerase [Lentisphaerae bacterium RIFOXYA12_FULL_48_11]|nr:MAG: xylose isomerase [Lentisphaerae bacterium RIFOXYA12_FULL_48_11]